MDETYTKMISDDNAYQAEECDEMHPAKMTDQELCAILLDELDKLYDLRDDIDGLASILQSADNDYKEYGKKTDIYHIVRSLERYRDTLENVIKNLGVVENP